MKNILLLTFLLFAQHNLLAQVPTCIPDLSKPYGDLPLFFPPPQAPSIEIDTMKNGDYFELPFTMTFPDSLTFSGITIPTSFYFLDTVGAITGLPSGIDYVCNPPSCYFDTPAKVCIKLYGVPNDTIGVYEMKIMFCIEADFIPYVCIDYPDPEITGDSIFIFRLEGDVNNIKEISTNLSNISCYPNPFSTRTEINFIPLQSGEVVVTLRDINGQIVDFQQLNVYGKQEARIPFLGENLPVGIYFYTIEMEGSEVTGKLVLQR